MAILSHPLFVSSLKTKMCYPSRNKSTSVGVIDLALYAQGRVSPTCASDNRQIDHGTGCGTAASSWLSLPALHSRSTWKILNWAETMDERAFVELEVYGRDL